jgi:autotransporter-associated beta strand protein
MISSIWQQWLRRHCVISAGAKRLKASRHIRLSVEYLETRTLLSAEATPYTVTFRPHDGEGPLSSPGPAGFQPSQIAKAYGFNLLSFSSNGASIPANGAGETIAIIDAYNDPTIATDLQTFDITFGLPSANLTVLNQTGGTTLPGNAPHVGWAEEESLDVEWAHAIAPGANIILFEANTNNDSDLFTAVQTAAATPGVAVASMSWGSNEFYGETSDDVAFTTPQGHQNVAFIASTGDRGAPVMYPAISPNVLAVGGTYLTLNSSGNYQSETAWSGSTGGVSAYEPLPSYQPSTYHNGNSTGTSTMRMNPDVAFDASPSSGFAVCDSYDFGSANPWVKVGGTSAGAPQWSALVAITDQGRALKGQGTLAGASQLLPAVYQLPNDFHDITSGTTTGSPNYTAGPGYDLTTGIGTPIANLLVPDLVNTAATTPTTLTWTGSGSTNNWSNPNNWGGMTPAAGDSLVFGPGASSVTSTNDLAAGTTFYSITFTGAGYSVGGNAVVLTNGIDASQATGNNSLSLGLTLANNETIQGGGSGTTLTLSGTINNQGNALTVSGGSGAVVINNTISGSGGLVENGSVSLTLSGTAGNTFTGGTTVQSGTLLLDESGATALAGPLTVGSGSGTALAQWQASNQLASGAAVTVCGSGTVDLNGNTQTATALSLLGGSLKTEAGSLTLSGNVSASGTSTLSGNLALTAGSHAFNVSSASTLTVSAVVSGSASLNASGSGTLVLSAANTYSGGTTVTSGTLAVGNGSALSSGVLTLNGGTLSSSGGAQTLTNAITVGANTTIGNSSNLTFTGAVTLTGNRTLTVGTSATATFKGVIGQSGSTPYALTKSGAGTLVLSTANTYTGGTTLTAGTVTVSNGNALGNGTLTLNGGTLSSSGGAQTLANAITFSANSVIGSSSTLIFTGAVTLTGNRTLTVGSNATATLKGVIGQSGSTPRSLTKSGAGTLVLSAANTYSGGTTMGSGTLTVSNGSALGSGVFTLSGGTLSSSGAQTLANAVTLNGNSAIGSSSNLTLTGAVTLTGNRTLTVATGATATITGNIGQSGSTAYSFTKAGAGTLVIAGSNTYTGGTNVSLGTLLVNGSLGSGTVSVTNGAILGGSGTMGPISVSSGGKVQPSAGNSPTAILSCTGVTFSSGSTFAAALDGATAGANGYDQLNVTSGTVNLGGSTLNVSIGTGFTPKIGETFTIIQNGGSSAITGTFNGLPEGGTFSTGGMTFQITYVGGSNGKSVVLTRIS